MNGCSSGPQQASQPDTAAVYRRVSITRNRAALSVRSMVVRVYGRHPSVPLPVRRPSPARTESWVTWSTSGASCICAPRSVSASPNGPTRA